MQDFPSLEFTLDGPGLSMEQIGAVLKYQQHLKAKRAARAAGAHRNGTVPTYGREEGDHDS